MARLNEPAAPVESVEAHFSLATLTDTRANSTQSLRIRNLEAETSRLLSENLALREQVISLQHELDCRPKRSVLEDLGLVKDKLDIKLAELGSLVFELGQARKSAIADNSPPRRRSRKASPKRSPDQRNWKNVLSLSEVTGGQDGRLPPIVEDKYYPRRTLDPESLLSVLNDAANSADSPDLGPPPVAHFDDSDPVKHDSSRIGASEGNAGDIRASLAFTNLETRKKRRESCLGKEADSDIITTSSTSLENTSKPIGAISKHPVKIGAKRKLSARDDEEHADAPTSTSTDGFHFSRRTEPVSVPTKDLKSQETLSTGRQTTKKVSQDIILPNGAPEDRSRDSAFANSNNRKALGEKSVNTDPIVSPHKPSQAMIHDKVADLKKAIPRRAHDRDRPRIKASNVKPSRIEPDSEDQAKAKDDPVENVLSVGITAVTSAIENAGPPPATPIYPDPGIFSPLSSQPSTSRPESRDTPPPTDIHSTESSTSTAIGRSTRRPRGTVSYAEPNLRDKMRRPGKELVDAVGADERAQRAASVQAEANGGEAYEQIGFRIDKNSYVLGDPGQKTGMRTVIIKKEEGTEEGEALVARNRPKEREKRDEPQSPLSAKTGTVAELPASVLTDRKRRISEPQHNRSREPSYVPPENKSNGASSSGSSVAIAALVAGIRGKQAVKEKPGKEQDVAKSGRDIYDFQGSSEIGATDPIVETRVLDAYIASDTTSKEKLEKVRHPKRASSAIDIKRGAERTEAAGTSLKTSTGSVRGRRRRETVSSAGSDGEGVPKAAIVGQAEGMGMRAERALARRRSMMV
ncbi:hypothetical protein MMC13_003991 [Lambiella insularis]|nr:hypothetical protein [Lambiella insularis]